MLPSGRSHSFWLVQFAWPLEPRLCVSLLVFVTGRGGAGFHSPDPALTRGRGGYVSGNPRPAPVRGPPALIPWTGPRLLPPIFNGDPSGVWVGRGPERGQGQGMPKKTPRPRPLSGAGRGKGPGARVFRGPVRPVTNSSPYVAEELHVAGVDVSAWCRVFHLRLSPCPFITISYTV